MIYLIHRNGYKKIEKNDHAESLVQLAAALTESADNKKKNKQRRDCLESTDKQVSEKSETAGVGDNEGKNDAENNSAKNPQNKRNAVIGAGYTAQDF